MTGKVFFTIRKFDILLLFVALVFVVVVVLGLRRAKQKREEVFNHHTIPPAKVQRLFESPL